MLALINDSGTLQDNVARWHGAEPVLSAMKRVD